MVQPVLNNWLDTPVLMPPMTIVADLMEFAQTVLVVDDAVAVSVGELPADLVQQREREIEGWLQVVREVPVDRRLHQQVARRDRVVVRHRRPAHDRRGRVQAREALCGGTGANVVFAMS